MWAARVLCCLLVVVAAPGVGAAAVAGSGVIGPAADSRAADGATDGAALDASARTDEGAALRQEQPPGDGTVTRVRVSANGSARWSVQVRTRLENDSEAASYRAFQKRFRNDTARYLDPFRDRIRGTVASAAAATGRPMNATEFAASTSIRQLPRRYGVVTYEFTWAGFARPDSDAVVVGDAFEGGVLLSDGDTLTVIPPTDYGIAAVEPAPDRRDDSRLTWQGPRSFADERPMARFADGAPTDGGTGTDTAADSGLPWYYAAAGIALLAGVLVVAGVVYRRRNGDTGGAAGSAAGTTDAAAPPGPPLTDADRVRELLVEADGQLKQTQIAEELGWSASKASRTLSSMEEEGTIERVRIGRENVVRLPGRD
jgi:hypothetical protein